MKVVERQSGIVFTMSDINKAFDRVNYWKLFNYLLDDNVPYNVTCSRFDIFPNRLA